MLIRVCVGSLWCALSSSGTFGFPWLYLGAPRGRRVHSVSRGCTGAGLGVVGFI